VTEVNVVPEFFVTFGMLPDSQSSQDHFVYGVRYMSGNEFHFRMVQCKYSENLIGKGLPDFFDVRFMSIEMALFLKKIFTFRPGSAPLPG
jgi:hypothetical protein